MRVADARSRKRRSHLYAGLTLAAIASIGLFQPIPAHAGVLEDILGAVSAVGLGVTLTPIVFISYLILTLSSIMLGWVGILFNYAVANLVFDFGHFFGNTAGMLAAWGVLRDVGNIALLFGFIFMGLQTILDIGHFSVGKALPRFLIFAVLMNFSLFAAEAVIDVSNALASSLYKQTEVGNCATVTGNRNDCNVQYGISGMILDRAGIGSVLSNKSAKDFVEGTQAYFKDPIGQIVNYLGLAMVVTTTWVVLLAGAVLLIARGIQLALLMITSPIGFAGMAIPPLEEQARKWWKSLFSQAFFAPVYLLLIFVGLKVTESVTNLTGKPDLSAALQSTNALDMQPLLVYALIIGFMIAALLAAKKFGIAGADMITSAATGTIGNITAGGVGFAYRRTLGAASNMAARGIRNSRMGTSLPGKLLAQTADIGAKASFDARTKKGLKIGGVDFGKTGEAAQKGRRGVLEEEGKKAYEYAKSVKSARSAADAVYKQKSKNIEREEKLALAKAAEASGKAQEAAARGDTAAATQFRTEAARQREAAEKAAADKKENNSALKDAQLARLSKDDQLIQKYMTSGGEAAEKLQTQETRAAELAAEAAQHAAEATKQVAEIARLQKEKAGYSDVARIADADRQIADAENRRAVAQAAQEAAERQEKTIREGFEALRKNAKAVQKSADTYTKADYAMEQFARTLERTAESIIGKTVLDGAKLRAGAGGIRSESGKSEEDQAWDHIKHILHEKGHDKGHDDGDGKGDDKHTH